MELLLIRHALPLRVERAEGPADPDLAPEGLVQADRLARWLAGERLDAVWSSPLRRARQTAEAVARATGLDVVIDEELAEFDRHSRVYIPVEELRAARDPRWDALLEGRWGPDAPSPERFWQVAVGAVERVVRANPSRRVAVVAHGMLINAYCGHALGMAHLRPFFEPGYTSISRVLAAGDGRRSVASLNETGHLRRC